MPYSVLSGLFSSFPYFFSSKRHSLYYNTQSRSPIHFACTGFISNFSFPLVQIPCSSLNWNSSGKSSWFKSVCVNLDVRQLIIFGLHDMLRSKESYYWSANIETNLSNYISDSLAHISLRYYQNKLFALNYGCVFNFETNS